MFSQAWDPVDALVVWLFSHEENSDDDYERYIRCIHEMDARGADRELPAAILVVDPGQPAPNAAWRRRIAEASATMKSKALFAVVSESAVVRGVVTAINWIRPPPYEHAVERSFDDAVAWIERRRGRALHNPRKLLAEAREVAAERARAPRSSCK